MQKVLILILFSFILISPCFAIQKNGTLNLEDGQKVKVYDKYGSYQGKYVQNGNKTKVYDKYGSYEGYSVKSGSKTKYYSEYGSYEAYSK
jgi:hypothetical protein